MYNYLKIICRLQIYFLLLIVADIDECSSDPCQNGGTCTDLVNSHTCACQAGYDGDNCQNGTSNIRLFMFLLTIELVRRYQN